MLSEKAKGKQRAVEPEETTSSICPDSIPEQRRFIIRFPEGIADLHVTVSKDDTVRDVKRKICIARRETAGRRLRLILSGQLLPNSVKLYPRITAIEERWPDQPEGKDTCVWMHCSVGQKIENSEEEEEDTTVAGQLKPARGFDRLASAGFSESDIANFRQQFHSQSTTNFLDDQDFENQDDYEEHARLLEEQWIDSMDTAGTAALSNSSSPNTSVMQGLIMGFFFPLLPFFFVRKPRPPVFWADGTSFEPPDSVLLSRATQVGAAFGLVANVFFGLWIFLLDSS